MSTLARIKHLISQEEGTHIEDRQARAIADYPISESLSSCLFVSGLHNPTPEQLKECEQIWRKYRALAHGAAICALIEQDPETYLKWSENEEDGSKWPELKAAEGS